MSTVKKMMLVDPRLVKCCETTLPLAAAAAVAGGTAPYEPVPNVVSNSLREMDLQMRHILDEPQIRSVDEKAQKYQQVLWRYLKRADQWRSGERGERPVPPPPPPTPSPTTDKNEWPTSLEQEVIESVPLSMSKKAQRLMARLKYHPDLNWTTHGEMKYKGRLVPGSNIVDLVNDVLRQRKRAPIPAGWKTFAEVLKEVNVPQELIGNLSRRKYTQKGSAAATTTSGGDAVSQPRRHPKWIAY